MGAAVDFQRAWSAEDLFNPQCFQINRVISLELKEINQQISQLSSYSFFSALSLDTYAETLFYLTNLVGQFIKKHGVELKYMHMLRLQLLLLLKKIKAQKDVLSDQMMEMLRSLGAFFSEQSGLNLSAEQYKELLIFETYQLLGVVSELSSQNKLLVRKVRNIELYSQLLSVYQKPKIREDYLEQFFNLNRSELLQDLVDSKKKIIHIHYDEAFLCNLAVRHLAFELAECDFQEWVNEQVQHVLKSRI